MEIKQIRGCPSRNKMCARCFKCNNHKLYISTKLMKCTIRLKLFRFDFFLALRRVRPKSPKRLLSLWTNFSGIEFDRRIKTTASYQSQVINLQNCVRLFRYSCWLLRNFTVNFDNQKLTDTFYDKGHCGRSILQNGNPSHSIFARYLGNRRAKFQGNPSSSCTV